MKKITIPWRNIKPIECPKRGFGLRHMPFVLEKLKRYPNISSPTGIQYNDDLILLDGHHSTLANILKSKLEICCSVIENDLEVYNLTRDRYIENRFDTIEEFLDLYKSEIKPYLAREGIETFGDYPLFKEMVRRGYA